MKYTFIALLCFTNFCSAQDISGLWVHDVDGTNPQGYNQFYGIMYLVEDSSGKFIGYTYDYHAGGWCSFYLEGEYDAEKNQLIAKNTKKIRKSFFHARCRYNLSYQNNENEEFLVGKARQKGVHGFMLSFGGALNITLKYRKVEPEDYDIIKGYNEIKPYINESEPNLDDEQNKFISAEELLNDVEASISNETNVIEDRKNDLITSHEIKSEKLTIEISDNNRQDGDRISIYLNDSIIVNNYEVTKEPRKIEINLPENRNTHKVYFVAENTGKVPPNTAKIKYYVDGVIYEEVLFTNLRTNKYLQFIKQ